MPPLRAVIFDLWNTLITDRPDLGREREKARLEGLAKALAAADLSVEQAEVERAYGEAAEELQRLQAGGGDLPSAQRAALFLRRLDPELAARAGRELLRAIERSPREAARRFPPLLVTGVIETLGAVQEAGWRTGLISNTGATSGPAMRPVLTGYGVMALLDVAVFSDEAAESKPAPGIFRRTLAGLGVEPAEAVFVGDTPELDVVGPQQVGMWTVQVGELAQDGVRPHARISALSDLPAALSSLGFTAP